MRTLICTVLLALSPVLFDAQEGTKPPSAAAGASQATPTRETILRDLATCAANTDRDRRLEAYDELAKKLGVAPVKTGNWTVTASTSPVDDSKTVMLGLGAEKEVAKPKGGMFQPQLVLRCKSGKLDVYTIAGVPAEEELPDHRAAVTVRFGMEKAVVLRMERSTDADALFWPDAGVNMEKLVHAERLVFQFSPKGFEPVVLEFDLRGLAELYPQLTEACAKSK